MTAVFSGALRILRTDCRLHFRGARTRYRSGWLFWPLLTGLECLLHLGFYRMFRLTGDMPVLLTEQTAWFGILAFMFSGACAAALILVSGRVDWELLLSSPVPKEAIYLANSLTVATAAWLASAWWMVPVINAAAAAISIHYLTAYLVSACLAMIVGTAGMAMVTTSMVCFGEKRGRWVATGVMIAATAGALSFGRLIELANLGEYSEIASPLLNNSLTNAIARAGHGETWPTTLLLLVTAGCLVAGTRLTPVPIFHVDRTSGRGCLRNAMSSGFNVFFKKELRSLHRDEALWTGLLRSIVIWALLPFLSKTLWKSLADALVFIGCCWQIQIVSSLALGSVARDEAGDLLRASPLPTIKLRLGKILASALVPLILLAAGTATLIWRGRFSHAAILVTGGIIASLGVAWLDSAKPPSGGSGGISGKTTAGAPIHSHATTVLILSYLGGAMAMLHNNWTIAMICMGAVTIGTAIAAIRLPHTSWDAVEE